MKKLYEKDKDNQEYVKILLKRFLKEREDVSWIMALVPLEKGTLVVGMNNKNAVH